MLVRRSAQAAQTLHFLLLFGLAWLGLAPPPPSTPPPAACGHVSTLLFFFVCEACLTSPVLDVLWLSRLFFFFVLLLFLSCATTGTSQAHAFVSSFDLFLVFPPSLEQAALRLHIMKRSMDITALTHTHIRLHAYTLVRRWWIFFYSFFPLLLGEEGEGGTWLCQPFSFRVFSGFLCFSFSALTLLSLLLLLLPSICVRVCVCFPSLLYSSPPIVVVGLVGFSLNVFCFAPPLCLLSLFFFFLPSGSPTCPPTHSLHLSPCLHPTTRTRTARLRLHHLLCDFRNEFDKE